MPLISEPDNNSVIDSRQSELAMSVRSGILRGFEARHDWVFVPELILSNGRRADLVALDSKGIIRIIEIKSSIADFRADQKWTEYLDCCDEFYFASHPEVPTEIFPESEGFILADQYGSDIIREANLNKLSGPTRKAMTLRIARAAAGRLRRVTLHEI
ncbi:MAG: MmcB family DNA repair protein [Rhizobiaceae bacterium]